MHEVGGVGGGQELRRGQQAAVVLLLFPTQSRWYPIALAAIRDRLRDLVPAANSNGDPDWMPTGADGTVPDEEFDFYRPPVVWAWLAGEEDSLPALRFKKALVLYGPPGTGKTYLATHLARHLAGGERAVKLVQFHPSYTYEDFFEGYRPRTVTGGQLSFELRPGPLRALADAASEDPQVPYILVIDELNRANLAKVFGELYFLLEYRDEPARLQYARTAFTMPRNLYVVGTMNTADRSIALLDAALLRAALERATLPA